MMGAGIFETGQNEISMISQELLKSDACRFRRCALRTDGFVSVSAPYTGWSEFTTHPLIFEGSALELNYSTSGGGSILVEIQDGSGIPIPGLTLDDCAEVFGDKIDGTVRWKGDAGLGTLSGKPVRMRVRMRDADLYAFRFRG